jgi:hypothetical protein
MGSKASSEYRARQRERERRRRQQRESSVRERAQASPVPDRDVTPTGPARRAAATSCGWCGGPITPKAAGPIPKWCSATCRHRAWEQSRAAASGRSAVEVVERVVTVPATPAVAATPRQLDWVSLLRQLAAQLEQGAIYDRHLPAIALAVEQVQRTLRRRPGQPRHAPRHPDVG